MNRLIDLKVYPVSAAGCTEFCFIHVEKMCRIYDGKNGTAGTHGSINFCLE